MSARASQTDTASWWHGAKTHISSSAVLIICEYAPSQAGCGFGVINGPIHLGVRATALHPAAYSPSTVRVPTLTKMLHSLKSTPVERVVVRKVGSGRYFVLGARSLNLLTRMSSGRRTLHNVWNARALAGAKADITTLHEAQRRNTMLFTATFNSPEEIMEVGVDTNIVVSMPPKTDNTGLQAEKLV